MVWRCENTLVPGAAAPRPRALRVAQRDEHRGARRVAGRSADRAGAGARLRRPLSPRGRAAREPGRHAARAALGRARAAQARQGRPQRRSSRSSAASRTICRAWSTRSASGTSARRRRRRWRGTSGRWTAILDAPVEALQTVPESARSSPRRSARFADEPHNRALVDEAARGRRQHGQPAAGRRASARPGRWPARPSS